MQEMSPVDTIVDLTTISEWIGLQTEISKKCLSDKLNKWTYDKFKLASLSDKFSHFKMAYKKDPTFFPKCHHIFTEIATIESELKDLIYSESKLEWESYNEILFFKPYLQPLNFIPFLLMLWSVIRVYILPGLSLMLPILAFIAPYIILKMVFELPLTFNNYVFILYSMITGDLQKMFNPFDPHKNTIPTIQDISLIDLLKRVGFIGVTLVQSIVQPYWTHSHLKSIDNIVVNNGVLILRFQALYIELETLLKTHGFTFFKCPLPELMGERDATARVILSSAYFKLALKYVGSLEVLMKLAAKEDIHPVTWLDSTKPVFEAKDIFDFHIPKNLRKTINLTFRESSHALLTGPNKGGKSTVLRSLSINALLAHTYGCSMGYLKLTPFKKIFVCLKPDDLPGSKSRFEREIEFTANTLNHDERILVFIDELYHSTNPPDALRSCEIYCSQLWKKPNVISVISTHLFSLVENADKNIQRICCPAKLKGNGEIEFMYYLTDGICKISSVDSLLKNNGLTF
jgi:energy-coupling factor transporter ATP-binding protein EcfA2